MKCQSNPKLSSACPKRSLILVCNARSSRNPRGQRRRPKRPFYPTDGVQLHRYKSTTSNGLYQTCIPPKMWQPPSRPCDPFQYSSKYNHSSSRTMLLPLHKHKVLSPSARNLHCGGALSIYSPKVTTSFTDHQGVCICLRICPSRTASLGI